MFEFDIENSNIRMFCLSSYSAKSKFWHQTLLVYFLSIWLDWDVHENIETYIFI